MCNFLHSATFHVDVNLLERLILISSSDRLRFYIIPFGFRKFCLTRFCYGICLVIKSAQMVFGKMEEFVALSPADDGNFSLAYNMSSVVNLTSDNSTDNMDSYIILISIPVLIFVFFIGFCYIASIRRGLQRNVIESFPVLSYNLVKAQVNGSECVICLNDFEDEEMVRLLPKCNHAFHPELRTSLQPTEESIPLGTAIVVVDQQAIDNGAVRIDISNDEATNEAPETSHGLSENSLVRVQKEHSLGRM